MSTLCIPNLTNILCRIEELESDSGCVRCKNWKIPFTSAHVKVFTVSLEEVDLKKVFKIGQKMFIYVENEQVTGLWFGTERCANVVSLKQINQFCRKRKVSPNYTAIMTDRFQKSQNAIKYLSTLAASSSSIPAHQKTANESPQIGPLVIESSYSTNQSRIRPNLVKSSATVVSLSKNCGIVKTSKGQTLNFTCSKLKILGLKAECINLTHLIAVGDMIRITAKKPKNNKCRVSIGPNLNTNTSRCVQLVDYLETIEECPPSTVIQVMYLQMRNNKPKVHSLVGTIKRLTSDDGYFVCEGQSDEISFRASQTFLYGVILYGIDLTKVVKTGCTITVDVDTDKHLQRVWLQGSKTSTVTSSNFYNDFCHWLNANINLKDVKEELIQRADICSKISTCLQETGQSINSKKNKMEKISEPLTSQLAKCKEKDNLIFKYNKQVEDNVSRSPSERVKYVESNAACCPSEKPKQVVGNVSHSPSGINSSPNNFEDLVDVYTSDVAEYLNYIKSKELNHINTSEDVDPITNDQCGSLLAFKPQKLTVSDTLHNSNIFDNNKPLSARIIALWCTAGILKTDCGTLIPFTNSEVNILRVKLENMNLTTVLSLDEKVFVTLQRRRKKCVLHVMVGPEQKHNVIPCLQLVDYLENECCCPDSVIFKMVNLQLKKKRKCKQHVGVITCLSSDGGFVQIPEILLTEYFTATQAFVFGITLHNLDITKVLRKDDHINVDVDKRGCLQSVGNTVVCEYSYPVFASWVNSQVKCHQVKEQLLKRGQIISSCGLCPSIEEARDHLGIIQSTTLNFGIGDTPISELDLFSPLPYHEDLEKSIEVIVV